MPCCERARRMAAVIPGKAARNDAATRAPRIFMMLRRVTTVGMRTNHATPPPQAHPSRRASSKPE